MVRSRSGKNARQVAWLCKKLRSHALGGNNAHCSRSALPSARAWPVCAVIANTSGEGLEPLLLLLPTPEEDGVLGETGDGKPLPLPLAAAADEIPGSVFSFFGEKILAALVTECAGEVVGDLLVDDVAVGLGAVVCTTKWCKKRPVCSSCLSEGSWLWCKAAQKMRYTCKVTM